MCASGGVGGLSSQSEEGGFWCFPQESTEQKSPSPNPAVHPLLEEDLLTSFLFFLPAFLRTAAGNEVRGIYLTTTTKKPQTIDQVCGSHNSLYLWNICLIHKFTGGVLPCWSENACVMFYSQCMKTLIRSWLTEKSNCKLGHIVVVVFSLIVSVIDTNLQVETCGMLEVTSAELDLYVVCINSLPTLKSIYIFSHA